MSTVSIPLRDGQSAIIDEADAPTVLASHWNLVVKDHSLYVSTPVGGGRNLMLHTLLMNPPEGFVVDHRNGNGLDNRRENLRVVTQSQNLMNVRKSHGTTSRFKGVYWESARHTWTAKIKLDQKSIWLGRFDKEEDAARAYNEAAVRLFGENARLNVLDGGPEPDGGFMVTRPAVKTRPPRPLPIPLDNPDDPESCFIDLGRGYRTRIDRADAVEVCRHQWYAAVKAHGVVYAVGSKPAVGMHTFLMKPPPGMVVDHRSDDKLDNRRSQLRLATPAQRKGNNRGRVRPGVPYKGIFWDKSRKLWVAAITVNGKGRHLGRYADPKDAARAYDEAAAEAFGAFARLNGVTDGLKASAVPERTGP